MQALGHGKNEIGIPERGYPSLVGGRPAKPVVRLGRAGSNPAPRAISEPTVPKPPFSMKAAWFRLFCWFGAWVRLRFC